MLDNVTKNRINTARDILVGKVPDPKSQVEQITIALIYKFMDDMDLEAEELGGNPSFFTGEYEKYGWRKIFDPALGGHEMLGLYGDAITKMALNPNLPQLFRDIFKNAYLPYRDPETLKLFLKTINEFTYDHSEMLGDAFEYLLSVLGSQGDAGQFRTPRHIIDFIVKLIDPKKNETICDPACGTAGFLISSYKHIVAQNTKKAAGDLLTPDDRKRMVENFAGYDISPDMVRLSLVNMYLHGFTAPQIYEYDSLTDETRWNEYYDVFLANPPFMTPKGGIRPSKKFSIDAKKAEVLFTDYIAEHLTTSGRAGIIVPNGIVATTQTAYKQLRKLLVENSLIAVISLPAGVFQPYSGVKTSILILDKQIAKKTKDILFYKIENDGFELGAQRREHDKNDLPEALNFFADYRNALIQNKEVDVSKNQNTTLVQKETILENKDVVLNAERYVKAKIIQSSYPLIKLKELISIQSGYAFESKLFNELKGFPIIRIRDIKKNYTKTKYDGIPKKDFIVHNGEILIGMDGEFNTVIWNGNDALLNQRVCKIVDFNQCVKEFVFRLIQRPLKEIEQETVAVTVKHISVKQIFDIKIPLPPVDIQQQIVDEINSYQQIIDGAKQVIKNYKPTITIKPEWEIINLGTVGKIRMCKRIFKDQTKNNGEIPFYKIGTFGGVPNSYISQELFNDYREKFSYPKKGEILISTSGTIGKTVVFDGLPAYFQDSNIVWISNDETRILNKFLYIFYQVIKWTPAEGGTISRLYNNLIEETLIPCPTIEEQCEIISIIQEEQALVHANKKLIKIFEKKIEVKINEVWGIKEKDYEIKEHDLMMVAETTT